jgi:lactate dehydrogenase-like 2-hydroxyacid dehydrogenase
MQGQRVLVTKRIYPEAVEFLRVGFEVDYEGTDAGLDTPSLLARSRGCAALVTQLTDRLAADVIGQLDSTVKIIAQVAVGYDNIDVPAATRRGILVTNTPGVLTETTADFAWALLMAAARRVPEAHNFVHAAKWKTWLIDLLAGQDVYGATLGIFGMGRIGQAVARRARGFMMRILYHDAVRLPAYVEHELGASFASKEELLREADFVSLHVPLLPETRHLIGQAELRMMKPSAVLVNTARGPVVDEAALADALEKGRIWSAGLDVFEREPVIEEKLLCLPNVVVAPHIASASIATRKRMSMMAAENAAAFLNGSRPANPVNPVVLA